MVCFKIYRKDFRLQKYFDYRNKSKKWSTLSTQIKSTLARNLLYLNRLRAKVHLVHTPSGFQPADIGIERLGDFFVEKFVVDAASYVGNALLGKVKQGGYLRGYEAQLDKDADVDFFFSKVILQFGNLSIEIGQMP